MTATVSAHDVAREIRDRLPSVGRVKVHKLLYYCQGWHLTWTGKPLFREPIEAWSNGPVIADFWADEQHDRGVPPPQTLSAEQQSIVDYVLERYGRMTGKQLITMTHSEDPWRDVSESEDPWVTATQLIGHDALREWFDSDEELAQRRVVVEQLRARTDIYSFAPRTKSPDALAAVQRAISGEVVRDL